MAIINVTLGSRPLDHIVPVNAGPDIVTFCEITAMLSATLLEDARPGDTFLWEQVLQHQYTNVNRSNNTITASGNLLSTFYSTREIINVYVGFETVETLTVVSATFDGTNTILTIRDPIPARILLVGVFEHAGTATDGSFTWDTPTDQLDIVISPLSFTNKRFRFWSNRGKRSQRYDDVNLILTPETVLVLETTQIDNMSHSIADPCRAATSVAYPNVPTAVNVCTTGDQVVNLSSNWLATWVAPTCSNADIVGYITQLSNDGGTSWVTVGVTSHIQEVSLPVGQSFRVLTLYRSPNGSSVVPSLLSPETITSFVIVPSNVVGTFMRSTLIDATFLTAFDTICYTGGATIEHDPITFFSVSGVVMLNYNTDIALSGEVFESAAYGNVDTIDPITALQVSGIVILNYNTDVALSSEVFESAAYGNVNTIDPITFFQASGNVTIGG